MVAHFFYLVLGLVLLVGGGSLLVSGAARIAALSGVPPLIIGLTVVAYGTSAPEMAVSVGSALSGSPDLAVSNVVGSNIFNVLAVLGVTGVVAPDGLQVSPGLLSFDMTIMIARAAACLPIFFTRSEISRWEGLLFLTFYISYAIYLGLDATAHAQTEKMEWFFHRFLLPAAVGIILISSSRELLRSCKRKEPLKST